MIGSGDRQEEDREGTTDEVSETYSSTRPRVLSGHPADCYRRACADEQITRTGRAEAVTKEGLAARSRSVFVVGALAPYLD